MAARAALRSLIGTDAQMNMLGIEEEVIFSSNATDTPDRSRMFVVIRWDEISRSAGGLSVHLASVWFHTPQEIEIDYGKIDLALLRLRELMDEVEQRTGADGWVLVAASWSGSSPDGFDDGYNSVTRYAQYRCSCRNVG